MLGHGSGRSVEELEALLVQRERDLGAARRQVDDLVRQQVATAEVLRFIARSPP